MVADRLRLAGALLLFSMRSPPLLALFPYTDALPISLSRYQMPAALMRAVSVSRQATHSTDRLDPEECRTRCRSEEHTSELQSRLHLVCRLLLEKKKHWADRVLRRDRLSDRTCVRAAK